ncbi:MAG: SIMPL domain-containing protein [Rikenellaceae bacterium]
MKKLFLVVATLLCIITTSAQNYTSIQNFVEVIGCSEIVLTPDIFYVVITIDEGDSKGRMSASEQQTKMIKELRKIGVDIENQLKINSLASAFERRKESYSTITYNLKLTSEQMLASTFEILDSLYISNVYLERTESSKYEEAKGEARRAAIINAREVADDLISAVKQKLGACFYIYDMSNDNVATNYTTRPIYYAVRSITADAAAANYTPLELKEIRINYKVKAKFFVSGIGL